VAAVFSGFIPMPWPGHQPSLGRLLQGDLYVLCGLAVLAGTALALALERTAAARADRGRATGVSPAPSWLDGAECAECELGGETHHEPRTMTADGRYR
jgi:hypothetical protein